MALKIVHTTREVHLHALVIHATVQDECVESYPVMVSEVGFPRHIEASLPKVWIINWLTEQRKNSVLPAESRFGRQQRGCGSNGFGPLKSSITLIGSMPLGRLIGFALE